MSLDSIVLCPPCLSLSLLFVSTCAYLGEAVVESPAPTRICEWAAGFIYLSEEASPGGRGRFIYLFIGGSSAGSLLRHGARSLVVARGFRTRSREGLQGFGGTIIGVLSDVSSQLPATNMVAHLRGQSCPTNSGSS